MKLLTRNDIVEKIKNKQLVINPFGEENLSEITYDIKISDEFVSIDTDPNTIIDPQNCESIRHVRKNKNEIILRSNSFILGRSVEWIEIPNNVFAMISGKSSLARLGIQVETAYILHPGHRGHVVLEINNRNTVPIKLSAGMRIAQLLFFEIDKFVRPYFEIGTFGVQEKILLPRKID